MLRCLALLCSFLTTQQAIGHSTIQLSIQKDDFIHHSMMQKINYRFPEVFQRCNTLYASAGYITQHNRLAASLKDEIANLIFLHYIGIRDRI